jgi:hypothetical protein
MGDLMIHVYRLIVMLRTGRSHVSQTDKLYDDGLDALTQRISDYMNQPRTMRPAWSMIDQWDGRVWVAGHLIESIQIKYDPGSAPVTSDT